MATFDVMREKYPNVEENKKRCNRSYDPCERKGLCCQCLHYPRRNGELPACYFSYAVEKTFDRSVSRFIQSRK